MRLPEVFYSAPVVILCMIIAMILQWSLSVANKDPSNASGVLKLIVRRFIDWH